MSESEEVIRLKFFSASRLIKEKVEGEIVSCGKLIDQ